VTIVRLMDSTKILMYFQIVYHKCYAGLLHFPLRDDKAINNRINLFVLIAIVFLEIAIAIPKKLFAQEGLPSVREIVNQTEVLRKSAI